MVGMDALRTAVEKLLANITCDGACQADLFEAGIIDELEAALKSTRPIPVGERLPEFNTRVLAFWPHENEWLFSAFYQNRGKKPPEWIMSDIRVLFAKVPKGSVPTHWLPLPPKPE